MAESWDSQQTEELFKAILLLENPDEARRFFRDLLTPDELIEFGKRWQTARLLKRGVPYTKIVKHTGLSSTTVARISHWLQHGKGGYQLMLRRENE